MKWVGQQIYDLTSRFRNSVYLEDISSGTIASGGYLGLDSNNKIVKAASEGDITGITLTAGTGVDLTSISGATGGAYAATIGVDVSDFMSNGGNGNIVTATGADAMTAHTYLTFTNDAGETATSLLSLLSNQDIGAKFTLATPTHGETIIATTDDDATAAHLSFDVDGDIKNIPESGTVYFYKSTNTDDYVKLDVGNDGDAKFTTLDAAATAAHFEIEADGNIILDAAGDIALEAAGNDVTVDADNLTMTSATDGKPVLTLKTTHTTKTSSAELQFLKDAADTEDGENLGLITFYGEDEGNNNTKFAHIKGSIVESDHAAEGGSIKLAVATHDGEIQNGLIIQDGDAEDEIDVTIGNTATSLTTITGTLTMGSTAFVNNSGVVQVATQGTIDHDSLANFVANEHLRWDNDVSSTATIHASNIPTLNQDTTGSAATLTTTRAFQTDLASTSSANFDGSAANTHGVTGTLALGNGGTGSTTGVQSGKNYRIVNCNFRADIGTTKYYLPLKSQDEQTVLTREEMQEVAVCDGRLVSITYRGEAFNTYVGDATVTFGVETNTVGTSYSSGYSVQETESVTINNADDQHLWHVVFDSAKHWDSTDMFAISVQSDTDITGSNERIFLTLVIEDDWSTYLAGSTREIDSTP